MVNSALSKSMSEVFCGDHKRTQQGVPNVFLHYIYY